MRFAFGCSDTHFGHENIRLYENRPFISSEHMDQCMINSWNSCVGKNDNVIHFGDFAFGNRDYVRSITSQLNGHIYLMLGNHDRGRTNSWWKSAGIKEVYNFPIIYRDWFIFSHEYVYLNANMPYANFHGHTHGVSMDSPQYFNCCVEKHNYTPFVLDDAIGLYKIKED